jgi:hypothetical protein
LHGLGFGLDLFGLLLGDVSFFNKEIEQRIGRIWIVRAPCFACGQRGKNDEKVPEAVPLTRFVGSHSVMLRTADDNLMSAWLQIRYKQSQQAVI